MAAWIAIILALSASLVTSQYVVPIPEITVLSPGIRFSIPHEAGITLVAYHYNINVPLVGVDAGQWNFDVNAQTNGFWSHDNTLVTISSGDVVYYWVYVLNGAGYQRVNEQWTYTPGGDTTTTTTTTTIPTTTTTQAGATTTTPQAGATTTTSSASGTTTTTSGGGGGTAPPVVPTCETYPCLVFEDNFDTLDFTKWDHELTAGGGGNWEFQYYTNNRSNSWVQSGNLYIKPTLTEDRLGAGSLSSSTLSLWGGKPSDVCTSNAWWGCERTGSATNYLNPLQSARLRTAKSFTFRYGRVEIRAKMPQGDWLWPAIWMLPKNDYYGTWPQSGEIDLVEARGNRNLVDESGNSAGVDQMGSAMHWGPYCCENGYENTHASKRTTTGTFGDSFHTYALDWDETRMIFEVDGEVLMTVDPGDNGFFSLGGWDTRFGPETNPWVHGSNKMAPFDKEFYLIMNVAVGGTGGYFSDGLTNSPYPKPWLNTSPTAPRDFWLQKSQWYPTWEGDDAAMQVDYVRVWKLKA